MTCPLALVALALAPQLSGPLALPEELSGALVTEQLAARLDGGLERPEALRPGLEAARLLATAPLEVPAEEATALLEELLDAFGFGLSDRGAEAAPRYALFALERVRRGEVPALELPLAEVESLRAHPALRVRTVLSLEGFDARRWFNTLRPFFSDPARLDFGIDEASQGLLLVGAAGRVARFAELMRAAFGDGALGAPPRIEASAPMELADGDSSWELARRYMRATGEVLLADEETRRRMDALGLALSSEVQMPAVRVPRVFEELARERGFVLSTLHEGARRVALVRSLDSSARLLVGGDARSVDAAALDAHPARVFVALLEGAEARAVANAARAVAQADVELLLPLDDERLLVRARGDVLARWRERLALAGGGGAPIASPPVPAAERALSLAPDERGEVSAAALLAASGLRPRALLGGSGLQRALRVSQRIEAPREHAGPVVEALLGELGLGLSPDPLALPEAALVSVLDGSSTYEPALPWLVPGEALARWREHGALQLEGLLPLEDARGFASALRGLRFGAVDALPLGAAQLWLRGAARELALVADLAAAARGAREPRESDGPWPVVARERFESLAGDRPARTLDDLIFEYGRATGQLVALPERVARDLAAESVPLAELRALPLSELPLAFERELRARGVARVELVGPPVPVVTFRREPGPEEARFVPLELVDACAAHPATSYTSVYRPTARGAKELAKALAASTSARVVPFEGGPALVLRAYGDELPALVAALRAADR